MLTAETEAELLARAAAGDRRALDELALACRPLVRACVRRFRGPGVDTDDLEGEGLLAACRALAAYRPGPGRTLAGFVSRCVRNALVSRLRQTRRAAALESDPAAAPPPDAPELPPRLLERLPGRWRRLLALHYGLGGGDALPLRSCAERLGCCYRTARRWRARALRRLRASAA